MLQSNSEQPEKDFIEIPVMSVIELTQLITIDQKDREFAKEILALCIEFRDVFSVDLRKTPARLAPMTLDVDKDKWEQKSNRLPPRQLSLNKKKELDIQLEEMLKAEIITTSQAEERSPSFFVAKPDGSWRFVVDFRRLNEASKRLGWPLPRIPDVLQRLGSERPMFMGVMDLTKGYYKILVDESSRKYTATSTPSGIFEWNRIPMGLTGAPSYFQSQLATKVLKNILYIIVELYIDDVLVHAKTKQEFLKRLRTVFLRFREFNITLNPKKCKFGVQEVEFLGHTINNDGIAISQKHRQDVKDFPVPKTFKEMKQFLGLANYFRDHVQNHSSKVHSLNELIKLSKGE